MKTIGEVLKSARLAKNLTLEQLSSATRIDTRYIEALEDNAFQKLPPATFTKGFVRNLGLALDRDPDEWLALLRRDYQTNLAALRATPIHRTRPFSFSRLFQSQAFLFFLGGLVFLAYLAFQYRAVITPPSLEITSPTNDAVLTSPVLVEGRTTSGLVITINDSLRITTSPDGQFQTRINLDTGQSTIIVSVTSRFGRTTTKTVPLTILSQ